VQSHRESVGRDEVVEAVLSASRALVAVAARSLAGAEGEVSLPQYRALVVLASRGAQRPSDLAEELGVHSSTAGRMCERLVRKELVQRDRSPEDRRTVVLTLTERGRALVDDVTGRRRAEISRLVRRVPVADRGQLVSGLQALSRAAGEVPDQDWAAGWQL
jgi:DNA-binding MarR family transcriptional regulator